MGKKIGEIRFTESVLVALATLADILNGNCSYCRKPAWGWTDVRFVELPKIIRTKGLVEEDNGHGRSVMNEDGSYRLTREVSFWMTNEYHLATIHLNKDVDLDGWSVGWSVDHVEVNAEPQYGRCVPA
jgi:hypothetical protein